VAAKKKQATQPATETYGYPATLPTWTQQQVEWECFLNDWEGGPGKAAHFQRGFQLTWPNVKWEATHPDTGAVVVNHWMKSIVDAAFSTVHVQRVGLARARYVVLSGVGAAGKTFTCACLAMGWWAAAPSRSIVVLTSTTKEMIGKRIWPVISQLHGSMRIAGRPATIGDIVDSRRVIMYTKGERRDEKLSITALAVAHGETQKAAHNLRGLHAERILVIVDEANGTPEAIFETIPNWSRACTDLTVILIGNPISRLDPHGLALQPEDDSTSPVATTWITKRVPNWDFGPGVALRFDGRDSPNVLAGRTLFPYIYTFEDYQKAQALGENTLAAWSQHRGLHPPEGLLSSVLNETALTNARVDDHLTFRTNSTICAFLDPAFGGDAAIVWFGVVGTLEDNRRAIQLKERHEILIRMADPGGYVEEPDIQVARGFISLCQERSVLPANAGIDATGTGRGVYAFVSALWSPEILRFEASASPGEQAVMDGDNRPASELFTNRITESWVFAASLVRSGQLKGLNQAAKVEFTTRVFHDKMVKGKRRLEDKADFRSRYGHSPDDADSISGLCDLARHRLELSLSTTTSTSPSQPAAWSDLVASWSRIYQEPEDQAPEDPWKEVDNLASEVNGGVG
jgi:hypothetical protein